MENNNNYVVAGQSQPNIVYPNQAGNYGLPVNSRFINQPINGSIQNGQFYSSINQNIASPRQTLNQVPQQVLYNSRSNLGYQSLINPNQQYSIIHPSSSNVINQSNVISGQKSSQNIVRSRLVPVTQYVPVYQVQPQVNYTPIQSQHIQQRVIMHEPQAFQERVVYQQEKMSNLPTIVEEKVYHEQQKVNTLIKTKVVKVPSDPLIETVQGNWHTSVNSKVYSPTISTPVPRQSKSCCSPWLLGLLGLLAIGGIITAILVGKNSSSSSSTSTPASEVNGTSVNNINNINSVTPLTNATIQQVYGTTVVTPPIPIASYNTTTTSIQPTYIPATDISQQYNTVSTSNPTQQAQSISQLSVAPINVTPTILKSTTVGSTQPSLIQNGVQPIQTSSTQVTNQYTPPSTIPYSIQPIPVQSSQTITTTSTTAQTYVNPYSVNPTPSNVTYVTAQNVSQ